ncbi:hypothetical protein [Blautia sp. MCC283]|uniref:hypothetical protein n=1 Tax=Blautia sp. MCC283 TaxID=2592640 RepID=UPI001C0376E0|nr:hypothetical protein [Blautia sp. MCC283]MBT9841501.1 hypothetical protein [Blautia sp. MCC283]
MYIRKNILFFVLAFSLVMASATASAEEENTETQSITKIKETEEAEISTLFSDSPEEQEPEVIEPVKEQPIQTETDTPVPETIKEKSQTPDTQTEAEKKELKETSAPITIDNWEWNDQDNVVKDNIIDISCNNTGYILTYQNFSNCLPGSITSEETGDIEIQKWTCEESELDPGTELLSLHKDSIHLLAVLADSYIADPEPLLTIRFLKLIPAGKFTGNEKGIWKWVVRNK